jgi:hypothetical protein
MILNNYLGNGYPKELRFLIIELYLKLYGIKFYQDGTISRSYNGNSIMGVSPYWVNYKK